MSFPARQRNLQKSISLVIEAEQTSLKWYPMADFVKLVGLEAEKAAWGDGGHSQAFQRRARSCSNGYGSLGGPTDPQNGIFFVVSIHPLSGGTTIEPYLNIDPRRRPKSRVRSLELLWHDVQITSGR